MYCGGRPRLIFPDLTSFLPTPAYSTTLPPFTTPVDSQCHSLYISLATTLDPSIESSPPIDPPKHRVAPLLSLRQPRRSSTAAQPAPETNLPRAIPGHETRPDNIVSQLLNCGPLLKMPDVSLTCPPRSGFAALRAASRARMSWLYPRLAVRLFSACGLRLGIICLVFVVVVLALADFGNRLNELFVLLPNNTSCMCDTFPLPQAIRSDERRTGVPYILCFRTAARGCAG